MSSFSLSFLMFSGHSDSVNQNSLSSLSSHCFYILLFILLLYCSTLISPSTSYTLFLLPPFPLFLNFTWRCCCLLLLSAMLFATLSSLLLLGSVWPLSSWFLSGSPASSEHCHWHTPPSCLHWCPWTSCSICICPWNRGRINLVAWCQWQVCHTAGP